VEVGVIGEKKEIVKLRGWPSAFGAGIWYERFVVEASY